MLLTDSATGEAVMSGDAVIGVAMYAWVPQRIADPSLTLGTTKVAIHARDCRPSKRDARLMRTRFNPSAALSVSVGDAPTRGVGTSPSASRTTVQQLLRLLRTVARR